MSEHPAMAEDVSVSLGIDDCMLLLAGLRAYLEKFDEHRHEDGGRSHPESQWHDLQAHAARVEGVLTASITEQRRASRGRL
jgi:hypothetical protein